MVADFLCDKAVQFSAVLRETSYRPFPEYNEQIARQYCHEPPRNCALVKKNSQSFGSPKMYALAQNTVKITVGLGVGVLSVSCWCVVVCVVWHVENVRV